MLGWVKHDALIWKYNLACFSVVSANRWRSHLGTLQYSNLSAKKEPNARQQSAEQILPYCELSLRTRLWFSNPIWGNSVCMVTRPNKSCTVFLFSYTSSDSLATLVSVVHPRDYMQHALASSAYWCIIIQTQFTIVGPRLSIQFVVTLRKLLCSIKSNLFLSFFYSSLLGFWWNAE